MDMQDENIQNEKEVTNLSLFWRILLDPCCSTDLQDLVKKEVSLWGQIDGGIWQRFLHCTFDLPVERICVQENSKECAYVENCQLYLDGCGLKVTDSGLSDQAGQMDLNLPEMLLPSDPVEVIKSFLLDVASGTVPDARLTSKGEFTEVQPRGQFEEVDGVLYYVGENIRLETEFTVDAPGVHPIFYYPKYSKVEEDSTELGNVSVQEEKPGLESERMATWEVTPLPPDTYESEPYLLRGSHQLVISQDQNFQVGTDYDPQRYFEFLVDTVPIRQPEDDDTVHLFNTGLEHFYIGYFPRHECDILLHGSIRRIMFDPHSSCYGC